MVSSSAFDARVSCRGRGKYIHVGFSRLLPPKPLQETRAPKAKRVNYLKALDKL
jgi:hypothetical protein